MALIVEDGTGKTDAESYASGADADAYVTKWHDSSDWGAASSTVKERALRRGARYINSHDFVGIRAHTDQALKWPRTHIGYIDGRANDPDAVPADIRNANIEAALRYIEGDSLLPDHDGGTIRRESKTVGPITTDTEYAATRRAGKTFEAIRALLNPYLSSGPSAPLMRGL